MAQSLAVKYRPKTFEEVSGQLSVIKILTRQLQEKSFKNVYLFCGSSGCGKTTAARIMANAINEGVGTPIEIDGASNNGVDNVKSIIKAAQERSIEGKYKIYIIDECHSLTSQAWQAFLKCIEEPPTYTIFIFCTTDPQKIPATILNRVQRFNFTKITSDRIYDRLRYICQQEGYVNFESGIDYISKICNGGMRDAIATLEKCAGYSTDISIENVLSALGNYSYKVFFDLANAVLDGDEQTVLSILSEFYFSGNDLKLFVDQYMDFCLDILKFGLFGNMQYVKVPSNMEEDMKRVCAIDNFSKYYGYIVDKLLNLKNMLKSDASPKVTIEVIFLQMTRLQ